MQLYSKSDSDFSELTRLLGLYFQIRDDYANLCLDEYTENKTYAEDLTEGKFSFPVIHAIRTSKEIGVKLVHILRQRTNEFEVKKYAVDLLREAGSFDYTKAVLTELDEAARAQVEKLGGNEALFKLLDDLKNWQ